MVKHVRERSGLKLGGLDTPEFTLFKILWVALVFIMYVKLDYEDKVSNLSNGTTNRQRSCRIYSFV